MLSMGLTVWSQAIETYISLLVDGRLKDLLAGMRRASVLTEHESLFLEHRAQLAEALRYMLICHAQGVFLLQ